MVKSHGSSKSSLHNVSPLLLDLQSRFIQVRALAELGDSESLEQIHVLTKHALATLDYSLFAVDSQQMSLPFTTVSAGAAVQDVAAELSNLARTYDVDLRVDITKKLDPVYANEAALKGALYGLASTILTTWKPTVKRPTLILAAQGTAPKTQRIGVYSPDGMVAPRTISRARDLAGQARSLAPSETHQAGLGLVISDQLATLLGSELQRFVHRRAGGIGFYVPTSTQLSLV